MQRAVKYFESFCNMAGKCAHRMDCTKRPDDPREEVGPANQCSKMNEEYNSCANLEGTFPALENTSQNNQKINGIVFGNNKYQEGDSEGSIETNSTHRDGRASRREKRGRFLIESAERADAVSTLQFQKGRFHVTQAVADCSDDTEVKRLIKIIGIQNKQIDILFDMVKNVSGDDKLFHKEFIGLANKAYEEIIGFKKSMK